MRILGINYSVDSAASLVEDGRIVAAVAEERLNREKHTRQFPSQAIQYCLREASATVNDIDYVSFFWNPGEHLRPLDGRRSTRWRHHAEYLFNLPNFLLNMIPGPKESNEVEYVCQTFKLAHHENPLQIYYVDHHLAHAASTFFLSPFDRAAILTVDGYGEKTCALLALGEGTSIKPLRRYEFPHSLGSLYAALTQYLGFVPNNGEGKVMALAGCGEPTYYDGFRELVKLLPDGGVELDLTYFSYYQQAQRRYSDKLVAAFGPERLRESPLEQRHKDLAASLQKVTEEALLHLARHVHDLTGCGNICLAGGVALNSVANGKILADGPFEDIFIQPGAGDEGSSLGSALYVSHALHDVPRADVMRHAYWGPAYSDDEIVKALEASRVPFRRSSDVATDAAALLQSGRFVGWFQGRAEFGPRALGNRSILADPRGHDVKDRLNQEVKHREGFRPYAPSVLRERCRDYFTIDLPSPFMLLVAGVLPEKQDLIPAIMHTDGTARIQTVTRDENPQYYRLIAEFEKLTGVPMVLNTSFNVRGEPMVCSPQDALKCFWTTGLDALVMGDFVVEKPGKAT